MTLLFSACNKEKDAEKFYGNYSGQITLTGTIAVTGVTNQEINQSEDITMSIVEGTADNEVVATYTAEGESSSLIGTVDGDKVTFEPVTTTLDTVTSEGIALKMTSTEAFEGTLSGNILTIGGTFSGSGTMAHPQLPTPIPFTASGTITGPLTKAE